MNHSTFYSFFSCACLNPTTASIFNELDQEVWICTYPPSAIKFAVEEKSEQGIKSDCLTFGGNLSKNVVNDFRTIDEGPKYVTISARNWGKVEVFQAATGNCAHCLSCAAGDPLVQEWEKNWQSVDFPSMRPRFTTVKGGQVFLVQK